MESLATKSSIISPLTCSNGQICGPASSLCWQPAATIMYKVQLGCKIYIEKVSSSIQLITRLALKIERKFESRTSRLFYPIVHIIYYIKCSRRYRIF